MNQKTSKKQVTFNTSVETIHLPESLQFQWDSDYTPDWTKMEKSARLNREFLQSGSLTVMKCDSLGCYTDKLNPHCKCGKSRVRWETRFANDEPTHWSLEKRSGNDMWVNAETGKKLHIKPACLTEDKWTQKTHIENLPEYRRKELLERLEADKENGPSSVSKGDIVKLKDAPTSSLGANEDAPILWTTLIEKNYYTLYPMTSEQQVRDYVNSEEFSTKFWKTVDMTLQRKIERRTRNGDIISAQQMKALLQVAQEVVQTMGKKIETSKEVDEAIHLMTQNRSIKQLFPEAIDAIYHLDSYRPDHMVQHVKSIMVIKFKFLNLCEKALEGTLTSGQITKMDFYRKLVESAKRHGQDLYNSTTKMMFAGNINLNPKGYYTRSDGKFFYVVYQEIVKQAEAKMEAMD